MARLIHTIVCMQYDLLLTTIKKEYGIKLLLGNPWPPDIRKSLDRIEAHLKMLTETWSVMAGRNIMADIVRELNALEPLLKDASRKACAGFRENLALNMRGHSPDKGRYHSALCLGYKVRTTWDDGYHGAPDDHSDMKQKAADLIKAIQAAYANVSAAWLKEPTLLKIFMAPEFYFRGSRGAYRFDDVNGIGANKGLLELLREEIDKDIYKDWLFVLGTVIAVSTTEHYMCLGCNGAVDPAFRKIAGTNKTEPVCPVNAQHKLEDRPTVTAKVDNVSLIIKEKFVHSVSKELVSTVDYGASDADRYLVKVNDDELPVRRYQTLVGAEAADVQAPEGTGFQDERMGGAIFTIDGVTFGCEVCLDHTSSAKGGGGRLDHAGNIQIQLLPSAGMSVKKLKTVENGLIFNVDGTGPHVQAIGLSTDGKLENHLSVNVDAVRPAASWAEMERDLRKDQTKREGYALDTTRVAPAAGPGGPVLQYGPFEIPAT